MVIMNLMILYLLWGITVKITQRLRTFKPNQQHASRK